MNSVKLKIRNRVQSFLFKFINQRSTQELKNLIVQFAKQRIQKLPADEALRFLFELDAALYPLKGQLAITYGDGVHTKHRHMKYHDFFVDRIQPQEQVLDIGCGYGSLAYDIAEKANAHVIGIDLNSKNIEKAQQKFAHPNIEYYVGDALADLPGKNFDVVVLSNVLEHLPERPEFLQQVQATIQPKRILIRVPLFERDWQVPLKKELGVEWRLDPTHYTEYTQESFAEEIAKANLKFVHHEIRWSEIWTEVIPNATKS